MINLKEIRKEFEEVGKLIDEKFKLIDEKLLKAKEILERMDNRIKHFGER